MKTITFICLISLFSYYSFGQESKDTSFILKGKIINSEYPNIYLLYTDKHGNRIKDSCTLQDGNFYFVGSIDEPTLAILRNSKFMADDENLNFSNLFLEPKNMTASAIYNHFNELKITGSKNEIEFNWLTIQWSKLDRNSKSFHEDFAKIDSQFIFTHPDSYVSAYILRFYQRRWALEKVKLLFTNLNIKVQNSLFGKEINETIKRLDENSSGNAAKDFNTKDINGNPIGLQNFKTHYLLLDFWASWCEPCRASNPDLIELYKKYHKQGFDIIGVSVDDDIKAWKAAVRKDKVNIWHNILSAVDNGSQKMNSKPVAKLFAVDIFPTKILIDKNGIIVERYVGTEGELLLDKKLAEIFK